MSTMVDRCAAAADNQVLGGSTILWSSVQVDDMLFVAVEIVC